VDSYGTQEGDRVLVEITDDGSGIPSEIQPHFDLTTKSVGKEQDSD